MIDDIKHLATGGSGKYLCPYCEGGRSREHSLSITVDEIGILYICHRASCKLMPGRIRDNSVLSARTRKKSRVTWEGRVYPLPDKVRGWLYRTWRIDGEAEDWWWTTDFGGRVAMPILAPNGVQRGWLLRSIRPDVTPKALTFVNEGEEGMSWYKTEPYRGTILVEDVPSAVRAKTYMNSVALLGTGIGDSRSAEIASNATRPIVVALDQDATSLAFKWARKYSLLWGDVRVLPLKKDIKDLTEEELKRLLNERTTRTRVSDEGQEGL